MFVKVIKILKEGRSEFKQLMKKGNVKTGFFFVLKEDNL